MEQYLLPVVFVLAGIIYAIGTYMKDRAMLFFSGFMITLLGIYLPINGFYALTNEFLLMSTTIIICGLGIYIIGFNAYQWILEGWGVENEGGGNSG